MEPGPEKRALSDPEAALYIGMSRSWLRQSRINGRRDAPPFVKIGRSVRYLRDDLDCWLEQCRRHSTVEPIAAETWTVELDSGIDIEEARGDVERHAPSKPLAPKVPPR